MKKRTIQILALACVLMQAACAYSSAETIFEKTDCENGFNGAYTVTGIEPEGCIVMIVGVDCNGNDINWHAPVVHMSDDLNEPYDKYLTGVKDGKPWFAKIQLGASGEVKKAWGQKTDGSYYKMTATVNP